MTLHVLLLTAKHSKQLLLACQIQNGAASNSILEQRYRAMCDERDNACNDLSITTQRMKVLEKQLHDKDREVGYQTNVRFYDILPLVKQCATMADPI